MKTIPLTQGKEAIVDDKDYAFLMQWKWFAHSEGYAARNARKADGVDRKIIYMHRVIAERAGFVTTERIDHKDGNGFNNRRTNLRPASNQKNLANRGPNNNNTSGFKGVSRDRDKWAAQIKVAGRHLHLGNFDSKTDAAKAYNAAAIKHFGEFAYQNPVGRRAAHRR